MSELGKFDGLTMRRTEPDDRPLLDRWVDSDPYHAHVDPEYFMGSQGCFAFEDKDGVVFFVRLAQVARVSIQFDMERMGTRQKMRVADALTKGMAMLEMNLRRAGVEEWIFDSVAPNLKRFVIEKLGFSESENELVRQIRPARNEEVA